jgi:hypothetical protein
MNTDELSNTGRTPDSVIPEEVEDDSPLEIAPDRRRVKTDKQDLPVETLTGWVRRGKLDLQPEFQRYYIWNASKASRLIESLLLEIPIPVVYVAEEQDGVFSVVDGQQRLTSLSAFVDGVFPESEGKIFKLTGLRVLKELNGKEFRNLEPRLQEKVLGTTIRLIVIEKDSDPDVKFEVFERLNLGAVALNDMELRNCVCRGSYNQLLRELVDNQHLLKVLRQDAPHPRMMDRQLILRFFAMWRKTHLKYKSPMKQFMNHEMEEHRNASPDEINEMRSVFLKSIEMAYTVFGVNAFRRFDVGEEGKPDGKWESKRLNIALWDTLLYGFSYFEKAQVIPIADSIREEFLDVMSNDTQFTQYITSATDSTDRIQYRADVWLKRLRDLIGYESLSPRAFTLEFKRQLFSASPACTLCNQTIQDVDDAEVDHVKHYWRGGKTIPENARLTHRYCNRKRGGRDT